MNWKSHLKPEEAARLEEIQADKLAGIRERKRIVDRARIRGIRKGTQE